MIRLLLLLILPACASPETGAAPSEGSDDDDDWFEADETTPACEFSTSAWDHQLTDILAEADDDGTIDYDPPEELNTRWTGAFDRESGEMSLSVSYIDGYKLVEQVNEGTVSLEANGDYIASYTSASLDTLDRETQWSRVLERQGCVTTATITNLGDPGSFEAEYTWRSEVESDERQVEDLETAYDGDPWVEQRISTPEGTDYTIDLADGRYVAVGNYPGDGTHSRVTTEYTDTRRYESAYLWEIHGGYYVERDGYSSETDELETEFEATYAYDGSSAGTYSFWDAEDESWVTCEYTRDSTLDEDCAYLYTCENGDEYTGDC